MVAKRRQRGAGARRSSSDFAGLQGEEAGRAALVAGAIDGDAIAGFGRADDGRWAGGLA
jgi:hypothetical protein